MTAIWMFATNSCNLCFEEQMFSEYAKSAKDWLLRRIRPVQLVVLIVLGVLTGITSQAQTANTGAITGTILDQSGAAIPNVEIAVTSESNASVRNVTTGSDGVYRVSLLPPGSYRIEAKRSGFNSAVRSDVSIVVTEITNLNLQLSVGASAETVTVSAQPEMIQTDSNALGRVADEKTVKSLPLAARNFTQIIGLSPGVSVGLNDATQLGTGSGGMINLNNDDLSVNGARGSDNNYLIDGAPANDMIGRLSQSGGIAIPNPDSIAEFKVVTGQ